MAELTTWCLNAGLALAVGGCTSLGGRAPAPPAPVVECDSAAQAMLFENQFDGLPGYVLAMTSKTIKAEDLGSNGVLDGLSYWSGPPVEGCKVLRAERPFDNPGVDIYQKRNRLTVVFSRRDGGDRQEFAWRGGLIVGVHYLHTTGAPLLGIEELDPDGSLTRRVLHLDGRERPFEFQIGPFGAQPQGATRRGAMTS